MSLQLLTGGTNNIDHVHNLAATMTGGVGNSWTTYAESNYRDVLGCKAAVIAEATTNIPAAADQIFTPWASITWTALNSATLAASTDGEYGSSSMEITCAGTATGGAQLVCAATAASAYAASCRVKANNAAAIGKVLTISNDGTTDTVTLTAGWQTLAKVDTSASGTSINVQITFAAGVSGDKVLVSAFQYEKKSYITPFAAVSRTASTMTFPTGATGLNLVAGQNLSIVVACRSVWAGNDGVNHTLVDSRGSGGAQNRVRLFKSSGNVLYLDTWDNASAEKSSQVTVTATNWAADTTHIIIVTRSAAGVQDGYLDEVVFTGLNQGAGTGLEALWATTLYIGENATGGQVTNAPLLVAIFDHVISAQERAAIFQMNGTGGWNGWLSPKLIGNIARLGGNIITNIETPLRGIDELHRIA